MIYFGKFYPALYHEGQIRVLIVIAFKFMAFEKKAKSKYCTETSSIPGSFKAIFLHKSHKFAVELLQSVTFSLFFFSLIK